VLFIVYEGDPADPINQTMRSVEAVSEDGVWAMCPHAISVMLFDGDPDQVNWGEMRRGTSAWRFS
jgi:hypothetical protein